MLSSFVVTEPIGDSAATLISPSALGARRVDGPFTQVAAAVFINGLVALLTAAAVTAYLGIPAPKVHDEFSYLLAADTFSHGRLTNPTHPMWPFFETFHVIQVPTYMSKYPPGQGLALLLGKSLGHPIVGVWLTSAAACAALTWALCAWIPWRWALLGGLLAPFHPVMVLWSQSYWGGCIALGGGALVVGGIRRLAGKARARDGWATGAGMTILALSRPYEGFVLTVLCFAALAIGRRQDLRSMLRVATVPLLITAVGLGLALAYYNARLTGDPLLMPYVLHERQYSAAPVFVFQAPRRIPMYRHEELRAHHVGWELPLYQEKRTISGFIRTSIHDLLVLARGAWGLFTAPLGPGGPVHVRALSAVLIIPLILLPLVLRRDWWMRAGAVILILFAIAILPVYWVAKHYGAPAGAVAYLLLFASMRQLHVCSWRHRPIGTYLVGAILLVWLASFAFVCKVLSSSDPQWAPASYRVAFLDALERARRKAPDLRPIRPGSFRPFRLGIQRGGHRWLDGSVGARHG